MIMKWTYTRIKNAKCSKWVSGNNWVTKYDEEMFCAVVINGKRNHAWMIKNPNEARKAVESFLSNVERMGGERQKTSTDETIENGDRCSPFHAAPCSGDAPPPRKKGWNHSNMVLVWYAGNEVHPECYGIAYYHYEPPFKGARPQWIGIDFSGNSYGRDPSVWWDLPPSPEQPCSHAQRSKHQKQRINNG